MNRKQVPLVIYLSDGSRKVVGQVEIDEQGRTLGTITDHDLAERIGETNYNSYSIAIEPGEQIIEE
jgi:hypothetical protein